MRKMRVGSLSLTGTKSKKSKDTAWFVKTKPLPLSSKGLGYVLSFWLDSNMVLKNTGGSEQYSSSVIWYDHAGKTVSRDPFALRMSKAGRRRVAMVGRMGSPARRLRMEIVL